MVKGRAKSEKLQFLSFGRRITEESNFENTFYGDANKITKNNHTKYGSAIITKTISNKQIL